MADRKKNLLPPSAFPMLMECPCYEAEPRPDITTTGSIEHKLLEHLVLGSQPPEDLLEQLSQDEVEDVEWAAIEVKRLVAEQGAEISDVRSERYVHITDDNMNQITRGRVDYCVKRLIIDYKSGFVRNYTAQTDAYALGWAQENGLETVIACEVYGRARRTRQRVVYREHAEGVIFEIVANVMSPRKKPQACQYCGWCSKRLTCPALLVPATLVFDSLDSVEMPEADREAAIREVTQIPIGAATPTQLSKMKMVADLVGPWADAVNDRVKGELASGADIPGYQVVRRRGNRYIDDLWKAMEDSGLEAGDFVKCCTASVTKLESAFAEAHGLKKAEAKRQLTTILGENVKTGRERIIVERVK